MSERNHLKLLLMPLMRLGVHTGRRIGNFGDAEVFSFHATKFLNAFEGAVATNNDELLKID
jgi:dTDP-4-amino-4,6-dideoxygalactose transaminase